ncbi:MAG: ABC transporter ATP-binding protein [Clostridium sp.]
MEILKASNIVKTYKDGENVINALDGASLIVNKGEFLSIVGPSGSGKSTLLHILAGMDKATHGDVTINGTSILDLNEEEIAIFRRRNMGFVFQGFNLIPILTAKENIKMPVLLDGNKVDEQYFEEIAKTLGIDKRLNHYPTQLSGGEQQRVAIARALINKPSIILADEPTGNLDSKSSKEVIELLRYSIKKYNQTLVMITHDMSLATKSDRIIYIEAGKVVSNGVI